MIIAVYRDRQGKEPLTEWLNSIRDRRTRARIDARLDRLQDGNFGDYRSLKGGLFELRLHFGSGYRIYYGRRGDELIILLAGGDKSSQTRDINKAKQYWEDYKKQEKDKL
jgi:putative addiction module killer protein